MSVKRDISRTNRQCLFIYRDHSHDSCVFDKDGSDVCGQLVSFCTKSGRVHASSELHYSERSLVQYVLAVPAETVRQCLTLYCPTNAHKI